MHKKTHQTNRRARKAPTSQSPAREFLDDAELNQKRRPGKHVGTVSGKRERQRLDHTQRAGRKGYQFGGPAQDGPMLAEARPLRADVSPVPSTTPTPPLHNTIPNPPISPRRQDALDQDPIKTGLGTLHEAKLLEDILNPDNDKLRMRKGSTVRRGGAVTRKRRG